METEHLNHDCSTLPNLAINPDITNELLLDSEIRSNTKTILEDVCNDFESIDVLSSKENKFVLLKKWKPPGSFSEYSNDGSDITNITLDRNAECAPAESVFISNAASSQTDSIQNTTSDENILNSQITTAIVPSLVSQNQPSSDSVNSVKNTRTEMVPLQDPSKVGILSDNFSNDKNLSSSLAELADAEIVQTSENAVSIIISNPRFIQVLNCKDSGLSSDTSDITLDSNCIVSEKENLNEVIVEGERSTPPTPVSNYSVHEDNAHTEKDPHTEVANEIIYSEGEEIYNFAQTNSSTQNTLYSKEKNRPYYRSRADLGKVAATRARRITAKMKTEWIRILEEKGFLVCPLSGCFQKYRTIANFSTHYKYCYSGIEKDLKHCPYCSSVIFSSHKAVLHHMKVEHPEKLEEYKTNFPQPEDVYDCFEGDNSRLVEISQKSLKNHKRKFNMAKENRLSPKKRILKNKFKTIHTHQPVIENSQLRECGRFDEIVSKISSVNKTQSAERDENKLSKERRKRKLILTGHVVTAEKYFEDERDIDETIDMPMEKDIEEKEKVNTKSRLVLNMDRYKRYTQYLTVTRDFGSHRRTYSRPKSSNVLDSSQLVTLENDFSDLDIHQLNSSLESSSISLNENDSLCLANDNNNSDFCCVTPEISAFDPLQSEATILNKIHLDSKTKRISIVNCETESSEIDSLKSNGPNEPIKEKIPCYKPPPQISVLLSPKIEREPVPLRKPLLKISPIITYGKIPDSISALKSDRPPAVDFDSLVKNSASTKKFNAIRNVSVHIPPVEKSKHNKEDGIKHPQNNNHSSIAPVKRKRGRPRKESAGGVGERPPLCKNLEKTTMLSENFRTLKKDLKTLEKSGNLKRVKENKSYSHTKKGRKISKHSKAAMNKISSKVHSKLLSKRRIKISAKSSLKKAIMCGVKRNRRERGVCVKEKKRERGRPPSGGGVCIKSLLKNAKLAERQKKNRECLYKMTPLKNSNTDHNYFSSLRICESQENSLCVNNSLSVCDRNEQPSEQNTVPQKENGCNISLLSSKEIEFTEILPEEVTIISTERFLEKEVILPGVHTHIPIESVENASALENEKDNENSLSFTEREENIEQQTSEKSVSSKLETGSDQAICSHPSSSDKVVCHEKDGTPVCVVKRSRGRPRKSATPQTKKADEETPKCTEKSLGVCVDEVSSPSPLSGVRKSERVRKRKFGSEIDNKKITERTETEKVTTEKFGKTGRRGRPRKYPRIEKTREENSNSEKKSPEVDEANLMEKQPDTSPLPLNNMGVVTLESDTPCNTSRGRRGRPRRERSETEITHTHIRNICEEVDKSSVGCVDKPADKNIEKKDEKIEDEKIEENAREKGKSEKKNGEKVGTEILVSVLSDSCSPSEKQLILPLKKRKKVEEKINSVPNKKSSICDISVEKEVTAEREKKVTSEKREMEETHTDIASLQASPAEAENFTLREKDPQLDKSSVPFRSEIECALTQHTDSEVYPTLKPNVNQYKVFSNKNVWKEYLEASVSILNATTCKWIKLKCFDSVSFDDSKSSTFFTGGPVQSCAFCPIPSHMNQYIAVASSDILIYNKGRQHNSLSYANSKNQKGLIEFWNLGSLESTRLNRLPCMELALEHEHGIITEMKWCPKGCFDLPLSSDERDGVVGSRLGLLALSCSDSFIRIYSIPHPNILPKTDKNTSLSIYNTNPKLVLTPLFSDPCKLTQRSIATCIDWARNTEVIAAGYGNGCICVWMVKIISAPSATIVTTKNEDQSLSILPYLVFEASGTPVTSISFAPLDNCQYLVSSSFDKTLRFFDLLDTSMPFCSIKRGFALNDVKWTRDVCGALVSLHDGIIFKGSSFTKECGTEEFPPHNIAGTIGSLTCSAISDITDMQAIADMTGTVSINYFHSSGDHMKQPSFDTHVIFETEVVELDENVFENISLDKAVNSEVTSVLNDAMDIVEVVMDEFTKFFEYNSPDNLNEVVVSTIACENKEMPCVSPVGDMKEKRHFPIEEMLNNTLPIHKMQLENVASNTKKLNYSDHLNMPSLPPSEEVICVNNSIIEDSLSNIPVDASDNISSSSFSNDSFYKHAIESDCGIVLENCVKSVSGIVLHWWDEYKLESSSGGFRQLIQSKSGCNAVPEKPVISECNVMPLQSIESECNIVALQSVESECSVVQSTKSKCKTAAQKSIEPHTQRDCHVVLQLKSDADSSDISNHGEDSDDSLSMISECSYASDSCDSIPSFLSDSLAPDTPSESPIPIDDKKGFLSLDTHTPSNCPIPIDDKKEFLSLDTPNCPIPIDDKKEEFLSLDTPNCPIPIDDKKEFLSVDTPNCPIPIDDKEEFLSPPDKTSSECVCPIPTDDKEEFLSPVFSKSSIDNKVAFSELSSLPLEEKCSSQPAAEESVSKIESNVVNTEELGCNEMPMSTLSTENGLENCIPNGESDLNHTHASDLPQTFDSPSKPECLLEGEQESDSVVPNYLLSPQNESDHIQTINGTSSPRETNSNDSVHMLVSDTVEELSSPDLFCNPQTSSQFLENVSSSEGTRDVNMYNSKKKERRELSLEEESPVSYASLISTCGLIFKDVNTISTSGDEKDDSLPIESNVLSSVNAISWNSNYGCHFWMVTAGNSGVARLICVSEISPQENTALSEKESIM